MAKPRPQNPDTIYKRGGRIMSQKLLKESAKTNYIASMLALAGAAFSSLANNVTTFTQNIAIAFGLMTGITAIISIQLHQAGETQ